MPKNATKKREIATLLTLSTKQRKILQRFYPTFTPTLLARWYVFTSLPVEYRVIGGIGHNIEHIMLNMIMQGYW